MTKQTRIQVYNGYGHTEEMIMYGHVFKSAAPLSPKGRGSLWSRLRSLIRLFRVKPYPFARWRIHFEGQQWEGTTDAAGFFKLEGRSAKHLRAGWYLLTAEVISEKGEVLDRTEGKVYVPHLNQYIIVSDIDDTVMISHSATIIRRLRELLTYPPERRRIFPEVIRHYRFLAFAGTSKGNPNPFFYVSSSEWNLYGYLSDVFRINGVPEGIFLLNQLKQWRDLWRTGSTGHEGKLIRIRRIMETFPQQKLILLGDNSQKDPAIYASVAAHYPDRLAAVYIRNVRYSKQESTQKLLNQIAKKGIPVCLFQHSEEAIAHSKKNALFED